MPLCMIGIAQDLSLVTYIVINLEAALFIPLRDGPHQQTIHGCLFAETPFVNISRPRLVLSVLPVTERHHAFPAPEVPSLSECLSWRVRRPLNAND